MSRRIIIFCLSSLLGLSLASALFAANSDYPEIPQLTQQQLNSTAVFTAKINMVTNGKSVVKSYSESGSIQNIVKKFDGASLESEFGSHYIKGTSTLSGQLDLRGAVVTAQTKFGTTTIDGKTYKTQDLHFCFQGECEDFQEVMGELSSSQQAALRKDLGSSFSTEDIWNQLVDWLKGKGGTSLLQSIADDWVMNTSIDPVAGNPNSFMAEMTAYSFDLANDNIYHVGNSGLNLFSVSPTYWYSKNNNYTVKDVTLPLRYSHFFGNRDAIFIDMPIDYTQIQTATTYSLALGLGYAHTFIYQPHLIWSLTPSFYTGVVGSMDLGSGTLVYNPALASRLAFPVNDKWTYGLTDDLSYLKTAKLRIGSVETPYDFDTTMMQNGVDATYHVSKYYNIGGFLRRSDVLGGLRWYINNYNQIGFKLAKVKYIHSAVYDHMSVSASYFFGPHKYNGGDISLGFNF